MAKILDSGREIIYIDETSTNLWEFKSKIWQPRNTILPMSYILPKTRGSNVTIIGAITNKKTNIFYHIGETTNIENFFEFLDMLESELNLNDKVLVIDNHKAHHNREILQFIK